MSDDSIPWLFLTGHHKAGKSWLCSSLQGIKGSGYNWTVGIDFINKDFTMSNGDVHSLRIIDSPGHEKFETLITQAYFKSASGFLLVFDITDEKSFESYTFNKWLDHIKTLGRKNVPVILVGTKCDLEEKRQISRERAQIEADKRGIKYFEASSVTRQNVDLVFETLAKDVVQQNSVLAGKD